MDDIRLSAFEARLTRLESGRQRLIDTLPVLGVVAVMGGLYLFTATQIISLDQRMSAQFMVTDERLDKIESRLDKIEPRLDRMETRLDRIEILLQEIKGKQ